MDRAAQRAGAFGRIRFIEPITYKEATGIVRAVYDQILEEYGLGGPFFVTSVSPPLLATTWNLLRTSMLAGPLERGLGEAIAAAVAKAGTCPFCVDVHSELATAAGEQDTASLVADGAWETLQVRWTLTDRLALWARDVVLGQPRPPPVEGPLAPYACSVALTFVHITSMVSIFQAEGLVAGTGGSRLLDRVAKAYMRTSLGKRMLERSPSGEPTPGLPGDPAPHEAYGFAQDRPALQDAWAAWDHVIGEGVASLLSEEARGAVETTIAQRQGSEPSFDLSSLDEAVAGLQDRERDAARVALLAGTAPYRVTELDLEASGDGGERGETWVTLAAAGVRARVRALARTMGPAP